MNVLITGCCGMIGVQISKQLLYAGFNVYGIDNFLKTSENPFNNTHFQYKELALKELSSLLNFKFINEDVINYQIPNNIDVIIHLAAHPSLSFSFQNPKECLTNNSLSFLNVIEYCRINNKPLIFASSSSVYGNESFAQEDFELSTPLSIYALSKKQNEETAKMYATLYNTKSYALRFFTIFGQFARPDMLTHKIMDSIQYNKEIILYGDGKLKRDFTFVNDISRFTYLLLKQESYGNPYLTSKQFHIFNIGSGNSISIKNFVETFEEAFQKPCKIKLISEKPVFDPNSTQCNQYNLSQLFPKFKFSNYKDSIFQTVSWYQQIQSLNKNTKQKS